MTRMLDPMTPIIHATSPAEFLTVVPRLLGFVPQRSVVLVPFRRGRSRGAMRLDLPPDDDRADEIAATMIGLVCRVPEADGCAIVVYGDTDAPARTLVEGIERRAEACGVLIVEALWVAGRRWGSYARSDSGSVPTADDLPPGIEDVAAPEANQYAGADLLPLDASRSTAVEAACEALDAAIRALVLADADHPTTDPARIDPRAFAAACLLDDLPAFVERLLGSDAAALDPFEIAAAAWALGRPSLRDIALICWVDGIDAGDEAAQAQACWEDGAEYPSEIAMRLWGEGPRPSPERLGRALLLARHIASAVPASRRPGPLAVAAWFSWALGRSTHADLFAQQATAIEPEHGLAEIVRSFVGAGHLPDWAFRLDEPEQ
tara:strand:+ start:252 stop:1382 length:1131 start_codon:yes stop_codon:yes gene_type:complete